MTKKTINNIYFIWYNAVLLHGTGIPFTQAMNLAYESNEHDHDTRLCLKEIHDAINTPDWPRETEAVLSKWAQEQPDFIILHQFFCLWLEVGMFLEVGCILYVLKKELEHSIPTGNDILYVRNNLFLQPNNPLMIAMMKWSHEEAWQSAFVSVDTSDSQRVELERLAQTSGPVMVPPGAQLQELLKQCLESGNDSSSLITFAVKLMVYRNILASDV